MKFTYTHTNFGASHIVDAIHMLVKLWAMAIPVPVVGCDEQVRMDHFMLERKGHYELQKHLG